MITKSFFDDLVFGTPEAVADMGRALKRHEEEGGYKPYGKLKLCTDPERIARFMPPEGINRHWPHHRVPGKSPQRPLRIGCGEEIVHIHLHR